jgi:two-component system response regulator
MPDILITEDDPAALRLTLKALKMADARFTPHVARNGAEAIAFITKQPPFENAPAPKLIILDWNLPKIHGREVPPVVRAHPSTKDIPIVVVTTSNADRDRDEALSLGVNDYVVKAPHFNEFASSIKQIVSRYLGDEGKWKR